MKLSESINNERFSCRINGKSFDLEWIREGHRNYPLISRAPSYSALHLLADHASKFAAFENSQLEMPSQTKREHLQSGSENDGGNLSVVVVEDQTKPPSTVTPAIFGISKKDLKRSIDMVTAQHSQSKKKHFHLKPPPPPPNAKIQHLYQTLNTKRPRKPFAKKSSSKTKVSSNKQSPVNQMASSSSLAPSSRLQFSSYSSMMPSLSSLGEKFVDGVELQKHLTSQTSHLMPPPMSPILKLNPYTQSSSLPTTSSSKNLLKINHMQPLEPQAHYIPNNRLKSGSEILNEQIHHYQQQQQQQPSRARSGRSKSTSSKAGNYSQKYSSNGASLMRNNSTDHIPDPQIIFNTSSTLSTTKNMEPLPSNLELTVPIESNDMDLSPAITSPLQLLSTAASCTPKLKVNTLSSSQISNLQQFHHSAQPLPLSSLPASTNTVSAALTSTIINHHQQAKPNIQNRAIKIIPANAKLIKAHQQSTSDYLNKSPQQTIIAAATPSKFKIQKIQLVMNKNQDSTNLSPSATIVSGKAGQLVLSGKGGITNTYQVSNNISSSVVNNSGQKSPYTIINSGGKATVTAATAPKVIVQTIDRNQFTQKDSIDILESQRITENTPIDFFLPVVTVASSLPSSSSSSSTPIISFPKVIIPTSNNSSATAPKQIKLKLSPGNIVNSKMFKNLKIQRNINTKGFTVLNTSQIVQIQSIPSSAQQIVASTNESTKTDWEQELDDANRSKAHLQIDDNNMIIEESTEEVEHLNEESSSTVYGKILTLFKNSKI